MRGIEKRMFNKVLGFMKEQVAMDTSRALDLSNIYGADIDPVDNARLHSCIMILFSTYFNDVQMELIRSFCWDYNFGKHENAAIESVDVLWDMLISEGARGIEVIDPEDICGGISTT